MNYGCKPPKYDARDYKLKSGIVNSSHLPSTYEPTPRVSVKNQFQVNSCVAHAISSILEWHSIPHRRLSTNFVYGIQKYLYNVEGKGMYLRDACKIAYNYGDMLESHCPGNTEVPGCYEIAEEAFSDQSKLDKSIEYRIASYYKCGTIDDIKYALCNHGPVLASLKWYNNYRVDQDGILAGGQSGDYGYHAFMIYGYNETGFLCQNSWGAYWGKKGRFILPYSIKLREARGIVDHDNENDLSKPKSNKFFDILYKLLNTFVNIFRRK